MNPFSLKNGYWESQPENAHLKPVGDREPTIGPPCERGGEIVDYTIGLCSCGQCQTPRPDWASSELPGGDT
jgi:hypothetical protein